MFPPDPLMPAGVQPAGSFLPVWVCGRAVREIAVIWRQGPDDGMVMYLVDDHQGPESNRELP